MTEYFTIFNANINYDYFVGAGSRLALYNQTRFVGKRAQLAFLAPNPICEECSSLQSSTADDTFTAGFVISHRLLAKLSRRRLMRHEKGTRTKCHHQCVLVIMTG